MSIAVRLRRTLDLQVGEEKPVALMTVYFMLLVFAFLLGRTARDALFLSRYGLEVLPYMYIGTALLVGVTSQIYSRLAVRLPPRLVGYLVIIGFAGSFGLFRLALHEASLFGLSALYLWVEVFGAIALVEFWNLAGEVFEPRQAKRLYGLVSAGQVFSNILCGIAAATLSVLWGVENLLWLLVAALLLVLPLNFAIERYRSGLRHPRKKPPRPDKRDPLYKKRRNYTLAVAAVVAVTFATTSVVDFLFKLAAREAFTDADSLAGFFGIFYGSVGMVGFFLQTFFTGRITRSLGVLETLGIMPGFFFAGSLWVIAMPGLVAATATKFFENTLRYSLNDPVTQLLYLPLPADMRVRALTFVSGLVRPAAMATAGLLMLAMRPYVGQAYWIYAYAVLILCGCWLVLLVRLKGGYLGAVATGTVEGRRLSWTRPRLDPNDPLVRETLVQTLIEAHPEKIDYALTLAERVELDGLQDHLRAGLQKEPRVRVRILRTIEARAEESFLPDILALLETEEHPDVRAALLRALGSLQGDRAVTALRKELGGAEPVRSAALISLAQYGGQRGVGIALASLNEMMSASDPAVRVAGVRVVGLAPVPHPAQILEHMVDDPDAAVARESIAALGHRGDVEALPMLTDALYRTGIARAAANAMACLGVAAVVPLTAALLDASADLDLRHAALEGLLRNPVPEAGEAVAGSLERLPLALRERATDGLWRRGSAGTWGPGSETRAGLEAACLSAISEAAWYGECHRLVEARVPGSELPLALRERMRRSELRALRLFGLLHPRDELFHLARPGVLEDPRKRQIVLELLDNTGGGTLAAALVALLEGNDARRCRELATKHGEIPASMPAVMFALTERGNRWLRACSIWLAAQKGEPEAILSLPGAQEMTDLVKKVLFLKSAPLFSHLAGEDLEKIAAIVEEKRYAPGELIFAQGDEGDALYIVTSGRVRVHIGETTVASLQARDCFGEMAILDDQPRSAAVSAVDAVACLSLRRDDFFALLEDHFEIVKAVIRVLTERLRTNLKPSAPPPPAAVNPSGAA